MQQPEPVAGENSAGGAAAGTGKAAGGNTAGAGPRPEADGKASERLEGLIERRDYLLKACGLGREYQARRRPLLEKIKSTEEMVAAARAKAAGLAKKLEGPVKPRPGRAGEIKEELNGLRRTIAILEEGLAGMQRELAALPEEDPALLVELARVIIAIHDAEKELGRGKDG
ncbi:MAG: hypothetical protein K6T29_05750 [Peptococcaceae bacterium]|nr:hypothetical protein [Peptococcaceae bacterium]